jgi:hypothetical protein
VTAFRPHWTTRTLTKIGGRSRHLARPGPLSSAAAPAYFPGHRLFAHPVGFQNSTTAADQRFSGRGLVLVDQAAEDRSTSDPAVDRLGYGSFRTGRAQLQCSMRPMPVVVHRIPGKHAAQVSFPEDQHPVGDLGSDGQHEASGEAVRPRASRRDLDYLNTCIGQHRVERGRELSGPIADEEPEPGDMVAEVHDEVAGLLGGPGSPSGCAVTPRTCR